MVADSGSTGNYISITHPHINLQPTLHPISVKMPDGKHVTSTHTCELLLPTLPPAARKAHVFPDFPTGALLSIGLLCDHGCTAHLDKNSMVIIRNNTIVLKGTRSPSSPLWTVEPPTTVPTSHQTPQLHANIAIYAPHLPPSNSA